MIFFVLLANKGISY